MIDFDRESEIRSRKNQMKPIQIEVDSWEGGNFLYVLYSNGEIWCRETNYFAGHEETWKKVDQSEPLNSKGE